MATPDSASAICSDSPAASDTGAVAPASMNGVIATGWPAEAHAMMHSTISESHTSGLLGLTMPMIAGVSAIASRPPQAMAAMVTASSAFSPAVP